MGEPYTSPCFCTNARRAASTMTELYDGALRPVGLTVAQYYLLINLSRLEPVDTTRLAGRVGLDRSTLVRNIRSLQGSGWVEDIAKGPKHQFRLTELGRSTLARAIPAWEATQAEFVRQFGQEDAEALMLLLRKVQNFTISGGED